MANYITIDIGNTFVKIMTWVDDVPSGPALHGALSVSDIEHLAALVNGKFDCAAVCSVSYDVRGIADAARRLSHRFIQVDSSLPLPFSLAGYKTTSTLGADRIAALAGARAVFPEGDLLVVDCGTAITYDRLSADNVFLGGNIAPGIGMRLRALHTFTARLPEVATTEPDSLWGDSTTQAMLSGAFYGVAAEIDYYNRQSPPGTQLVLTGGRAANIARLLPYDIYTDPDLVLIGLKHIIDYIIR